MPRPESACEIGYALASPLLHRGPVLARRMRPAGSPRAVPTVETPHGQVVETTPAYPPAASVLAVSRVAYLRLLAGHRRRVARELAEIAAADKSATSGPRGRRDKWAGCRRYKLPFNRGWGALVTVRCAGCRVELLGWCEEYLRAEAEVAGLTCRHSIPPPVAARVHDRPYCRTCCPATW
jgi:hypothetical protein